MSCPVLTPNSTERFPVTNRPVMQASIRYCHGCGLVKGLFLMACFLTVLSAIAQPYPDPLIEQRADPWICKHQDGTYYFIATVPEYDRIELRHARTIPGLATAAPKVIWRKHDHGPMSWHIWAPELHQIDGNWYVYFAAGKAEAIWDIRMYVLENPAAESLECTSKS